jgi:hypothetical protein
MPSFLKSKMGRCFAGIYLFVIIFVVFQIISSPPHAMNGMAILILTAPFSIFLAILFDSLGITSPTNDQFLYVYVAFGGFMNILILQLFGYSLSKLIGFLSSSEKKDPQKK